MRRDITPSGCKRAFGRWLAALTIACVAMNVGAGQFADPTRPVDAAPEFAGSADARASHGPVLQSTVVSPARTVAVIDGKTVGVGDKVNGGTIVAIRPYEVQINKAGREVTLRLVQKFATTVKTVKSEKIAKGKNE